MKSFFSKIGTLLLCGVAVAMVGCNDLQEDINKAQNDISAVTVTVEDLQKAIAALEAEQDKMAEDYAKKADVEAAKTALESQLATEKAALNSAIATINQTLAQTATKNELKDLQTSLNALSTELQTKAENLTKALEGKADKAQVEASFASLATQYEALNVVLAGKADTAAVAKVKSDVTKLIVGYQEIVQSIQNLTTQAQVMSEKLEDNTTAISTLKTDVESLKGFAAGATLAIQNLSGSIDAILTRVEVLEDTLKEKAEELADAIEDLEELASKLEDVEDANELQDEAIEALKGADKLLEKKLTDFELAYNNQVAEFKSQIKALQDHIDDYIAADDSLKAEFNNKIEALKTTLSDYETKFNSAIADLEQLISNKVDKAMFDATLENLYDELAKVAAFKADIDKLLDRVQSLVYVPDFSDHKANINFATVTNNRQESAVVVRETIMRYRVLAKANETASMAAEAIVKTWEANPNALSFALETVATRAAVAEPSLKITKVRKVDSDLYVHVVAKNFDPAFFAGTPGTPTKYSAALVLSDGNNNLSSEYTNLTPGDRHEIVAVVLDSNDVNITGRSYIDAPVAYLPYDRDPEEVSVLKGHRLAFNITHVEEGVPYTTTLTADDLISAGYDLQITRTQISEQLNTGNKLTHLVDLKSMAIKREFSIFHIEEREGQSITKEGETYVTLREDQTKAQFLSLKTAGQNVMTIEFLYNINGVKVSTEGSVNLSNRLVNVNLNFNLPWTLKTALSTVAPVNGVDTFYAGPLHSTHGYTLVAEKGKSLEGYSLSAILANATDKEHGSYNIKVMNVNEDNLTIRLTSKNTEYKFPVNDNDETVDANAYKTTYETEFEDLTIIVNVTLNLQEMPKAQAVTVNDIVFTTSGQTNWLAGYWDALGTAYNQFKQYLGYEVEADGKAAFYAEFGRGTYATPKVNGKDGIAQNTLTPFNDTTYDKDGKHCFTISASQANYNTNGYIDGAAQTIIQNFESAFGIPFSFTVNGVVDMPSYALDLDGVRVINNVAKVKGEIVNDVYTVDVADLAKYYYVVNQVGTKKLELVNEGDDVKVEFVLSPVGTEETGYYFKGTTAANYVLAPDFTSSEPYVLPMDGAVVNWGSYPNNEIGVKAVLTVCGFPVADKSITLVTEDPLNVTLNDVTVELENLSGTNATEQIGKVYSEFVLTSTVEPTKTNLFDVEATDVTKIFDISNADTTYGADLKIEFVRVYYKDANDQPVGWDMSKIVLGNYDSATKEFDGTVYIKKDDANIETPVYVESKVTLTHNLHNSTKTACESVGYVTVTFKPAK